MCITGLTDSYISDPIPNVEGVAVLFQVLFLPYIVQNNIISVHNSLYEAKKDCFGMDTEATSLQPTMPHGTFEFRTLCSAITSMKHLPLIAGH